MFSESFVLNAPGNSRHQWNAAKTEVQRSNYKKCHAFEGEWHVGEINTSERVRRGYSVKLPLKFHPFHFSLISAAFININIFLGFVGFLSHGLNHFALNQYIVCSHWEIQSSVSIFYFFWHFDFVVCSLYSSVKKEFESGFSTYYSKKYKYRYNLWSQHHQYQIWTLISMKKISKDVLYILIGN